MKIILLDKVVPLGGMGYQVDVKNGYARNFLIPKGKAVLATKDNIKTFASQRLELESKVTKLRSDANVCADNLKRLAVVSIKSRAGVEGKLFGSIRSRDIINAIALAGIQVAKNSIKLKYGALRFLGSYDIMVHVYSDIFVKLKVIIEPE